MTEADPKANILGHFDVQGVNHAGALKLDGATTELQVYSEDFFHLKTEEMACVRGVSNEGVSISALHCIQLTSQHGRGSTASWGLLWLDMTRRFENAHRTVVREVLYRPARPCR